MSIQQPFLGSQWASPASFNVYPFPSVPIPLEAYYNNHGASLSSDPTIANFDGFGGSYAAEFLPVETWLYDLIKYQLPSSWGVGNDNVLADSQIIVFPEPVLTHELHVLYAGDGIQGATNTRFVLHFEDNSTQVLPISAKHWWTRITVNAAAIETPIHYNQHGHHIDGNRTNVFQWSTSIPSYSKLKSIQMPPRTSNDRLHLFALSVTPALPQVSGPSLSYRRVRPTSRWEAIDGIRAQVYEVTLANLVPDTAFETSSILSPLKVEMFGATMRTVKPGVINRLTAGDQVVVDVLVENLKSGLAEDELTVVITDSSGNLISTSAGWPAAPLHENFGLSTSALENHETPTWWNEAKFGIFIHWGPYSVPGWGPPYTYAEWYDWGLHSNPGPNNGFYEHQLKTYGKKLVYDDFFANLTGSKFNASEWVNLFDDAGAKYFVFTTKHHDGFGMFDTGETTHRNSLHLGPKRDFLKELFDTAKAEKPQLHRGTYFSMPEWFNPDYAPYGFDTWPGELAHNVFNQSEVEPYTGRLPIKDYLADLQLPQMVALAEKYDTEIMWCDISSANLTRQFAQHYFTHAWAQGRQVVINDRCGDLPDHDTPEYAKLNAIQPRKWETSEGMDPASYGYNRATPASAYKNGNTIIQTLVDIVSKNGNYLLDVGPTAEGEIPEIMQQNLRDAGGWLKYAGDCVYGTEYWFRGSEDPTGSIRFLTTPTTFCIVSFEPPTSGQLVVQKRVPISRGDRIHLLSPHGPRICVDSNVACGLPWSVDRTTGYLTIDVSDAELDQVDYAWAFQIQYNID